MLDFSDGQILGNAVDAFLPANRPYGYRHTFDLSSQETAGRETEEISSIPLELTERA